MEVELALSAHALLSGEEEGEVHSDIESHPEAVLQELFSFNAAVESGAGRNEQAQVGAVAPVHAVPLSGGMGGDVQARGVAIETMRAGSSRGSAKGVVQSQANKLVLDNFLNATVLVGCCLTRVLSCEVWTFLRVGRTLHSCTIILCWRMPRAGLNAQRVDAHIK